MNEIRNRVFKIWSYTVSHSFLILRSPMKFPDQDDYDEKHSYNIDIEFTAVVYVDIPVTLGINKIKRLQEQIPNKFVNFKKDEGVQIFEIASSEGTFYVVAGGIQIGKNRWLNKDRISNLDLEHDEIFIEF